MYIFPDRIVAGIVTGRPPVSLEYHTAMHFFAVGMVNARLAAAASRRRFSSAPDVQMHRDRAEAASVHVQPAPLLVIAQAVCLTACLWLQQAICRPLV